MPDKMNMKIHVGVEYSGLPSPNLILPNLLNAKVKQNKTDKKVKINTIFILLLTLTGSISWKHIESECEWGILLLFGGGLALSMVMDVSGGSAYLAEMLLSFVHNTPVAVLTVVVITFAVFMTELVSNTASAALLIPIFISLSNSIGLEPQILAIAIAVSASCAFMLPVATPPNALVYATQEVPQKIMMRTGLLLNIFCIFVISIIVSFI